MTRLLILTLAATAAAPLVRAQDPETTQQQIEELRSRIDELEEQQASTSDRLGGRAVVQAYTAQTFDFGGHVTSLFTYMDGAGGSEAGHVVSLVELFLRAQLDDQWSLFATPGFFTYNGGLLDDPTTTTAGDPSFISASTSEVRTFLPRLYGQWQLSDELQVQAGIVGSPHGTTNREYFIPARTIGMASLHTRLFMANSLYPQLVEGGRVSGKRRLGETDWLEYDAYFGVEDDSAADGIGGARLAYVFGDYGLSLAANYGRGTREATASGLSGAAAITAILNNVGQLQTPFAERFNGGRDYEFVGIDIDWRAGSLISKTEAYISSEGIYADQRAFSTEWTYFATPQWGLSYRFDYYDPGSDQTVVSLTPFATMELPLGHSTEHVVGVSYNPNESVRIRLDAHHNNLPNTGDTVDFINLSWSISF